jgi:subtilisin family serine protease
VRALDGADHGTGVAWIIGGRRSAFGRGGLAPAAFLFHVPNSLDKVVGRLPDLVAQHNVHVVNFSVYWDGAPNERLSRAIKNFEESALFVVAAGNDSTTRTDGEVCRAFTVYPVCWADRKNVLVVTATNKERSALLPPLVGPGGAVSAKGANWSPTSVHVAAQGEGFFVPGANGAYVPARGSSFATPFVTATAALLYAQGVQRPALIKQRILATADPVPGLAGLVKGGVLNLRRALSHPYLSSVVAPGSEEAQPLFVVPGQEIVIVTSSGQRRDIPLDNVLRLHKHGTAGLWRIVYAPREALDSVQIEEDVEFTDEADSTFRYFALKEVTSAGGDRPRYWVSQAGEAVEGKLVDYEDFLGPAIPAGR